MSFTPQAGMTLKQVNDDAYVPCPGSMNIKDDHLIYVGNLSNDPLIKIYRTVAYEKFHKGTGACTKNLYFQDGILLSDERVKQIEDEIKAKQELERSYDQMISQVVKEKNLTQIYKNGNFYIYRDSNKQYIFFKDGKQVDKSMVIAEIQSYNDKLRAEKEADQARIAKEKQEKIDAAKNAATVAAMMRNREIENAKAKQQNLSRTWSVTAGPPEGKNYSNCSVTEVRQGRRNDDDGSVTFQIAYRCWRGTSGSSGLGEITCGVNKSKYVNSTSYSAQCH